MEEKEKDEEGEEQELVPVTNRKKTVGYSGPRLKFANPRLGLYAHG